MRTFIGSTIGSTRYSVAALAAAAIFAASTAYAQVSVQTGLNATVQAGSNHADVESSADADGSARASTTGARAEARDIEARVNGEAMSQLHATTTAKLHASDESALMASSSSRDEATSTDEGRPVVVSARFLGLFPVHLTAHAIVGADGSTEVKYPWYSFLFALRTALDASAQAK